MAPCDVGDAAPLIATVRLLVDGELSVMVGGVVVVVAVGVVDDGVADGLFWLELLDG